MKRVLTCLLLALAALLPFTRAEAADEYLSGDLNGDGQVTAADASRVLRAADGVEPLDNTGCIIADVDGTMTVDRTDATAILMFSAGQVGSFFDLSGVSGGSLLGTAEMERFAYTGTVQNDYTYRSRGVSVTVTRDMTDGAVYYLADIYIHNLTSFGTAFAEGGYLSARQAPLAIAANHGAVLALTGDGNTTRNRGPVIRNGVWYCDKIDRTSDLCILYKNGEMKTYAAGTATRDGIVALEPYQSFLYGPRLLDDYGLPITRFTSGDAVAARSSRAVLGYYSPGHYAFLMIDGRQEAGAVGLTLTQLSRFCFDLGFTAAYNLQGGLTAQLMLGDRIVNTVSGSGRTVADILYIAEPLPGGNG